MTKELSRKELYDLVWSKPMITIAQEYGLSDRGLAKLCARNSIPVPPRGYWARKDAGQPVQQPVFHPTPKGKPDRVAIHGNPLPPEVTAILQEEKKRKGGRQSPRSRSNRLNRQKRHTGPSLQRQKP